MRTRRGGYSEELTRCDICGEGMDPDGEELGEFVFPDTEDRAVSQYVDGHLIAHAECGIARGLELA